MQKKSLEAVFQAPGEPAQEPVDFSSTLLVQGVRYNIHARSLPDDLGLRWYVFSVYPESEFVRLIGLNVPGIIMGILLSFLLVAAFSIYLASIFRKPIDSLVLFSQGLSKGSWQGTPEPSFLYETEIIRNSLLVMKQRLSDSFSALNNEMAAKNEANREIKSLLAEKEIILKKVHHRMKNNLNVIVSLLRLQEGTTDDENTTTTLREASLRIQSMSVLYDMLFQSENFIEADVADYLKNIIAELSSHYDPAGNIAVYWDEESLVMPSRILFVLGIIVNEAITNAYKYAFPQKTGEIHIHLAKPDERAELSISDNGIGFRTKDDDSAKSEFGMRLMEALVDQIDGQLIIEGTSGVTIRITFPLAG